MDKDKLTDEYKAELLKIEQELDNLNSQKRKLEEKEEHLHSWKQWDTAHLEQLHSRLQGEDSTTDRLMIEDLLNDTQHISRQAEQQLELEHDDIDKNRKRLYEQAETYRYKCKQTSESAERGELST